MISSSNETNDGRQEKTDLCRSLSLSYRGHAHPSFDFYTLEKSVSCQKKDGRGHVCPSFFWYNNNKDLKVCFLVTHSKLQLDVVNLVSSRT